MNAIHILVCTMVMVGTRAQIDRDDCYTINGYYGKDVECLSGFVAVRLCVSASDRFCNGYSQQLHCCKYLTQDSANDKLCYNLSGSDGENLKCYSNSILTGICGSGRIPDCNNYSQSARCCYDSNISIGDACSWQWGDYGVTLSCPDGTVAAGYCNGGEIFDCDGGRASHGIWCCSY